ncbi:hypothetical protein ROZALSC1DRAFT_21824 [Rozella allomycis CSF55]|uniref:Uncharacterized protein n=1 Tax=Rozella allomycis (strain CSF55) TaxID=988480 RepID=A0A4P9YMZ9_ROZAC|nr:hypothetical protein ROZALSC1DRAFT_21824 [Rozella allomycis CSF55]
MDDISTNYLRSKLAFSEPSIFEKEIKVVPYSDLDYVMAAELLDTFVGTISKRTNPVKNVTNENRHKTQFLVNYPELLQNLSLLKVLLYQVLKNQFNYNSGGIVYQHDSEYPQVREFAEAIYAYKVRLAACYARLRIEKQAIGSSPEEVLRNILPKEDRQETQIGGDRIGLKI